MGTRSITRVIETWPGQEPQTLVTMYRQYDGYIDGHGHDLAKFLAPLRITNGISGDSANTANGGGCLAAQMVAHFKPLFGVGGIYLQSADSGNESYNYEIHVDASALTLEMVVRGWGGEEIFRGSPADLLKFEEGSDD